MSVGCARTELLLERFMDYESRVSGGFTIAK